MKVTVDNLNNEILKETAHIEHCKKVIADHTAAISESVGKIKGYHNVISHLNSPEEADVQDDDAVVDPEKSLEEFKEAVTRPVTDASDDFDAANGDDLELAADCQDDKAKPSDTVEA